MGVEENKEVVRRYLTEILANLDYSHAEDLMHEDFYGMGGEITSLEEHENYFKSQRKKIPDARIEVVELIAEGDKVVSVTQQTGTDTGGFLSPTPTNKRIELKVIAIYTVRNGKIAYGDVTYDGLKLFQQVGFYPPLPEEK